MFSRLFVCRKCDFGFVIRFANVGENEFLRREPRTRRKPMQVFVSINPQYRVRVVDLKKDVLLKRIYAV